MRDSGSPFWTPAAIFRKKRTETPRLIYLDMIADAGSLPSQRDRAAPTILHSNVLNYKLFNDLISRKKPQMYFPRERASPPAVATGPFPRRLVLNYTHRGVPIHLSAFPRKQKASGIINYFKKIDSRVRSDQTGVHGFISGGLFSAGYGGGGGVETTRSAQ